MTLHLKTKNTPTHTFFYIATQPDVGSFPGCSCPTSLIPCRSLNIPHPRPSGPVNVHFDSQAPSHPSRFSFSSCLSFLIFSRATCFLYMVLVMSGPLKSLSVQTLLSVHPQSRMFHRHLSARIAVKPKKGLMSLL